MATGSKAGLYQNVQSASYLPLTLPTFHIVIWGLFLNGYYSYKNHKENLDDGKVYTLFCYTANIYYMRCCCGYSASKFCDLSAIGKVRFF